MWKQKKESKSVLTKSKSSTIQKTLYSAFSSSHAFAIQHTTSQRQLFAFSMFNKSTCF